MCVIVLLKIGDSYQQKASSGIFAVNITIRSFTGVNLLNDFSSGECDMRGLLRQIVEWFCLTCSPTYGGNSITLLRKMLTMSQLN